MMKSYLLIPIFLVFSLFASSQSIINFTHFSYLQNKNVIGYITGYDTHFAQADSNKVSFESATDTLSFWVKSSSTDNNLSFSSTKHFDSEGLYSMKVENNIDGEMLYVESIYVKSQSYASVLQPEIMYGLSPRLTAGDSITATYSSWLTLDSALLGEVYLLGHLNDTITVKNVKINASKELELKINCPITSQAGYYHLMIEYGNDTLLRKYNALFIDNPNRTQIAIVTPDSMNNLSFYVTEITIVGNHTHFTMDSNIVLPLFVPFDSLKVINDTLLKAYIRFPLPVKSTVYTNANIQLYNPIDGFLQYPIRFDMYGSVSEINDYENIKLFPNPTSDYIHIESKEFENDKLHISIYSMNGQKVKNLNFTNQRQIQISLQEFAAGVYIINIQGDTRQKTLRFIKE